MNRRRLLTLLVTMVLLEGSLVVGGGVTATSAQAPGPVPAGPQAQSEGRSRAATLDERFAEVAQRAPGFGGVFLDEDVLKVYLVDPGQRAAAERAIAEVFGPGRPAARGVQVLQAQYPYLQLRAWHEQMQSLFDLPGVILTDIDEGANRLEVGVQEPGSIGTVEQELARLRIPRAAVNIVVTEPVRYAAALTDNVRPLQGGIQIAFSQYRCTLGFNAIRAGVEGFVGNSHCTNTPGVVEGTEYYQPTTGNPANLIGHEIADPPYTPQPCPRRGRSGQEAVCWSRWSDSAFSLRETAVTATQGLIARPQSPNTNPPDLTIAGSFQIVSEGPSLKGDTLNKVGITTGWTQGRVMRTCADSAVAGTTPTIVLICQDYVAAGVNFGDSGSPVFQIPNPANNGVELRGILWGLSGRPQRPLFVYSPIANVQRSGELGPLTTCAAGASC
jgi:hypothetical protein